MELDSSAKARRLVICLDGTNNEPGKARTNVQRLYRVIARLPDKQLTYYQPGVGTLEPIGALTTFWRRILMLADSAGGWMMKRHVCSAYEYLCENYRHGDEIYLFGFSRGAQAARVLAGMLTTVGLLHPGMREMVPFAWKAYTSWAPFSAVGQIAKLLGHRQKKQKKRSYFVRANGFKGTFSRPVRIRFLGLWDTVSSVGAPWNPKIYNFSDSNHGVDMVRHALSLDEHRVSFEPKPWFKATERQDVKQVWFPGVHADIGGGYAGRATETAKISLAWMIAELKTTSISFDQKGLERAKLPDLSNAKMVGKAASRSRHDELQKLRWKIPEILPLPRWLRQDGVWKLALKPHLGARRKLPDDACIHSSVGCRMEHDRNYRPGNLPVRP